ncbi:MAG: efflux RND transporter periplasmic adaptor subunit [Alphaproteobacteria bacterium]|nr:efflux RND transporter periplasmic adaptor subunit [Alphaproteobacteria bacterium]
MKTINQLAIIAVLAAAGTGAWYYKDQWLSGTVAKTGSGSPPPAVLVQVKPARLGTVTERVESVATALANESVTITSKVAGIVEKINIAEGERVKAGQVLVQFDDKETVAELEAQKALTQGAFLAYDRAIKLKENQNVAQAKVDDLLSAWKNGEARIRIVQAKLADLKITAPFSGKVGLRRVSVGALIQPGTIVTTLDDVDTIRLKFSVPETLLANIKPGLEVEASASAYSGRTFKGAVTSIDSRVDAISRAIEIRADIPNPEGLLKPGMFMSYRLALKRRENAVLVPEEALLTEGTRQFVFVVNNDRTTKVEVKVGDRGDGEAEILSGLAPGDMIVVAGIQKVRNGTQVKVAADRPQS